MAKKTLKIADKPSLDKTLHAIWLTDYKTFGTDSYVYNNKDVLYELYRDYTISLHDNGIRDESLTFAINNDEVGDAFKSIYGIDESLFTNIHTVSDLVNDEKCMSAIMNESCCDLTVPLILNNITLLESIVNNEISLTSIANNYDAVSLLISDNSFVDLINQRENAKSIMINNRVSMRAILENGSYMCNAIASDEFSMNILTANTDIMNLLYDNAIFCETNILKILQSTYLLTSCQNLPNYKVIESTESIVYTGRRTHYSGKCLVLGMSQTSRSVSGYGNSYIWNLLRSDGSSIYTDASNSYGKTGLTWRINRFAEQAVCTPEYRNVTSNCTAASYMAILKL